MDDNIYRVEKHFWYQIYILVDAHNEAEAIKQAKLAPNGKWNSNFVREWVQVVESDSPIPTAPKKGAVVDKTACENHTEGELSSWAVIEDGRQVWTRDVQGESLEQVQEKLEKDRGNDEEWLAIVDYKERWAD